MPNHPAIECDTPRVRTDPGRPLPPSRATRLTNATRLADRPTREQPPPPKYPASTGRLFPLS
ncbi:hypothetical protein WOLCODRAFT_23940, partial [Wolfiporia cocos MD-104 SS10]